MLYLVCHVEKRTVHECKRRLPEISRIALITF